jgi:hypothetical protein
MPEILVDLKRVKENIRKILEFRAESFQCLELPPRQNESDQ